MGTMAKKINGISRDSDHQGTRVWSKSLGIIRKTIRDSPMKPQSNSPNLRGRNDPVAPEIPGQHQKTSLRNMGH